MLVHYAITGGEFYDFFETEQDPDSALEVIFGGPLVFAVVLAAVTCATRVAVIAALRGDTFTRLAAVALTIPCAVYFWFVEPFGFSHAGLTIMIVGYAISREMRRVTDEEYAGLEADGSTVSSRLSAAIASARLSWREWSIAFVAVVATGLLAALAVRLDGGNPQIASIFSWVLFAAAGFAVFAISRRFGHSEGAPLVASVAVIVSIAVAALIRDVSLMLGSEIREVPSYLLLIIVLVQVLASGVIGIAAMLASVAKGIHLRYGAICLGIGALCLFAWVYDVAGPNGTMSSRNFAQWFGATIVVSLTLWAMWYLFGPGAIVTRKTETVPEALERDAPLARADDSSARDAETDRVGSEE